MFNERLGFSVVNKLHDYLKKLLLNNFFFMNVLARTEKYYILKEWMFYNAEFGKCNIYKFLMYNPSCEKLKINPEFKKDCEKFFTKTTIARSLERKE